jgi:glucans biosynthesis protein C
VGAERRPDIDWLRAAAVYLLLVYHTAKVFDEAPFYHLKNAEQSEALNTFTGAIHQWHMPLLFVLAGWSATASLDRRGRHGFLRERRQRVLVPLVFGCVAFMPFIKYVELRQAPGFDESFLEFLPTFPTSLERFTWAHLWFLAYLLVFSLLYMPLFEWLRGRDLRVRRVPPWALYAAIVPFAVVQVSLRGRWPGYQNLYDDWANFAYYSLFFIAGFLLTRFPAIEEAVHRERRRAALIGIAALAGMSALSSGNPRGDAPAAGVSPEWVAFASLSAICGVCLVAAILGYGARYLRFTGRSLAYARDSAMPVYVLHQAAIVAAATAVVALPAGIPVKFALVLAGGTAATVGAYHLLVRRSAVLRALLGTKGAPPEGRRRKRGRALLLQPDVPPRL